MFVFSSIFSCHSCHLESDLVQNLSFCFSCFFSLYLSLPPIVYPPHFMPVLALAAFGQAQVFSPSLLSPWESVSTRNEERGLWSHSDLDFTPVLSNSLQSHPPVSSAFQLLQEKSHIVLDYCFKFNVCVVCRHILT